MICPYCKEDVHDGAVKCKHCKSQLIESSQQSIQADHPISQQPAPAILNVHSSSKSFEQLCLKCEGTGNISICKKMGYSLISITITPLLIALLLAGVFGISDLTSWQIAGFIGVVAVIGIWTNAEKCTVCEGKGKVTLSAK